MPGYTIDPRTLSPFVGEFENWLAARGYEAAVECCPYVSEDGGFQFTDGWAIDLVHDFLVTRRTRMSKADVEAVENFALDMGEVANTRNWGRYR